MALLLEPGLDGSVRDVDGEHMVSRMGLVFDGMQRFFVSFVFFLFVVLRSIVFDTIIVFLFDLRILYNRSGYQTTCLHFQDRKSREE